MKESTTPVKDRNVELWWPANLAGDAPKRAAQPVDARPTRSAPALMPLFKRLEAHVLVASRLHGDDTTVPVLADRYRPIVDLCAR